MDGMTVQERLQDISKRSGVNIDMVRSVLNAEAMSITESLLRGEKATMIGRVTLRPDMRIKPIVGGGTKKVICVHSTLSSAIQQKLDDVPGWKEPDGEEGIDQLAEQFPNLLARQVSALAGEA